MSIARLLLGMGLAGAAIASPARAETILATESAPTAVRVYDGPVAWWSVDPRTHAGRLMTRTGGHPQRVPIAPVHHAYALDLGPTANGHVAAVYSRCDRHGRRCDVYAYDFTARRERPVKVAASPRVSERLPTLWRRRIAFVEGGSYRRSGRIVLAGLRGGSRHLIRGGLASDHDLDAAQPASLDLRGRALTFEWDRRTDGCVDPSNSEGNDQISQIWYVEGATRRRLDSVCSFDAAVYSPGLLPSAVGYLRLDDDVVVRTRRLDGTLLADVPISSGDSASRDGAQLAYERYDPGASGGTRVIAVQATAAPDRGAESTAFCSAWGPCVRETAADPSPVTTAGRAHPARDDSPSRVRHEPSRPAEPRLFAHAESRRPPATRVCASVRRTGPRRPQIGVRPSSSS